MIVTCVTVFVKEEHINDFIEATKENHKNSIKELGNLRFDVLQCFDNPARFMLYEAYESDNAEAEHKKTDHYLSWRKQVADWMAQPREGIKHNIIFPSERDKW